MVIPAFNIHAPEFFMTVSVYYSSYQNASQLCFLVHIVSLFKIQQDYYMRFGKGNCNE